MTGAPLLLESQRLAIQQTYAKVMAANRPVEQLRGSVYAERYYRLPAETRGGSGGKWKNRAFQIGVLDMLVSDQIRELYWQKSARTGATKMIVCSMLQHATHLKRNVGFWGPNDDDRDTFVVMELEPAMRDCRVLHPYIRSGGKTAKWDTLERKMLIGSAWQMLGGSAEGNFRGRSPDTAFADEASAFPINIGQGGSLFELLDGRVTESQMPKVIGFSSPKMLPYCQISKAVEQAEIQLKFLVPCPHCEHEQPLEDHGLGSDWGLYFDLDPTDMQSTVESVCFRCQSCSGTFTQRDYKKTLQWKGRWKTADGSIWLDHSDGLLHNENGPLDGRWSVGLQSGVLISPVYQWQTYVRRKLKALEAQEAGDHTRMITFQQTRMGLPTKEQIDGIEDRLHARELESRQEYFPDDGLIPDGVQVITMFIDCHKLRFEIMICGWGFGEECWILGYEIFHGNLVRQQSWDRLKNYIEGLQYERVDGRKMNVYKVGIDYGGHWANEVTQFSREMGPDFVIPCFGRLNVGKQEVFYPRKHNEHGIMLTQISTDPVKLLVQERLRITGPLDDDNDTSHGDPVPGMIHIPKPDQAPYQLITRSLMNEFASEVRIVKNGRPKWEQMGKNEGFDTLCGNTAVIRICQLPQFGVELSLDDDPYTYKGGDDDESFYEEFRKEASQLYQ